MQAHSACCSLQASRAAKVVARAPLAEAPGRVQRACIRIGRASQQPVSQSAFLLFVSARIIVSHLGRRRRNHLLAAGQVARGPTGGKWARNFGLSSARAPQDGCRPGGHRPKTTIVMSTDKRLAHERWRGEPKAPWGAPKNAVRPVWTVSPRRPVTSKGCFKAGRVAEIKEAALPAAGPLSGEQVGGRSSG